MRTDDIIIERTPVDIMTHGMYVPPKKPVEDMTLAQLVRGMCCRSQRNLAVCRDRCKAPCSFGREILRRCNKNDDDGA